MGYILTLSYANCRFLLLTDTNRVRLFKDMDAVTKYMAMICLKCYASHVKATIAAQQIMKLDFKLLHAPPPNELTPFVTGFIHKVSDLTLSMDFNLLQVTNDIVLELDEEKDFYDKFIAKVEAMPFDRMFQ